VEPDVLDKYLRAGEIAAEVREEVRTRVEEGVKLIDICEWVEDSIRKRGAEPAFPCNISINEIAAHYTSPPGDETVIPPRSLVKVDIGVHVDGYIADTATTICLDPLKEKLVRAVESALREALREAGPRVRISRISALIEKTIRGHGCKPISNLTGHNLARYTIHAGISIPNVAHHSLKRLEAGQAYAIEPFATEEWGAGFVVEGIETNIFRLAKTKARERRALELLRHIQANFKTLPFAERWLWRLVPRGKYEGAWRELLASGAVVGYPVFIERLGCPVAQAEHTIVVLEDKCIITTLPR